MQSPLPRRSFLTAACLALGAAKTDLLRGASESVLSAADAQASPYLATLPRWGLRPGSGEDQSAKFQALIDAVAQRGGGSLILPGEHAGQSGSYLVRDIRPRSNVLIQGLHGATLQLPAGAGAHLFDNHGEANLSRFVLRGLILDGGGQDQTLVRIKRFGTSGYAWDRGGMYEIELRNAAIGADVEWSGQAYYRGGRVDNCGTGLRLTREHLYLQDITLWGCQTGIFADQLLHTHWDHVVFGHGGAGSTAIVTPKEGGPHIQESRLINCEIIDYRRGFDVRYLLDTQISGWRFKSIDFEGILADFSGMVELSSCRFLGCAGDPSGSYSAVKITGSAGHTGWRIHDNLARSGKPPHSMKHGFDLSGLADGPEAVIGHGNIVQGSLTAGYRTRPRHTHFTSASNLGSFTSA